MAGDWIKMRVDLHTHPKVVRIASALKADRLRIIGALHAAWCLFDAHSDDGYLDGYRFQTLDDMIGFEGFSYEMSRVGWLEETNEGLVMPRFEAHNGQSAKRRAQEADRKRNARKVSASDADKKRTREEKRREDIKDPPYTPQGEGSLMGGLDYPKELNLKAWEDWCKYRTEMKFKPYVESSQKAAIEKLLSLTNNDSTKQHVILYEAIANGWMSFHQSGSKSNDLVIDYDGAFTRLVIYQKEPQNEAEKLAQKLACNANLKRGNEVKSRTAWRGYLNQAYKQTGETPPSIFES